MVARVGRGHDGLMLLRSLFWLLGDETSPRPERPF
jgi:hypothetical protein